ncbi:MAG: zincin-like metallopeptidase domain-containing protein [Oscillospiraceae bacterium]|nr:zincin-like metallopeptidase domain-containing protein [Oscillospiraceae bacterium]
MASKENRKPYHEQFAEQIIEDLKKGTAPWLKPWQPGELHAPHNPISGTVYSGINRVMLSRREFDDPRWMTLRQANSIGCRVRKGEKSQPIVFWQFTKAEPARDDQGKPILDGEGNQVMEEVRLTRPIVRFSSVFHVSQLDGDVPPLDPAAVQRLWDPNQKAETILENSGAVIKHNQRNRAFYSLRPDEICLPPQEQFPSADGYYSTALHELGHWTGHPSRMDREFGPFGSEPYAREELRAEIASWMLGQDLGIGHDPGQHLAYVDSWVSVLEKDPYEIVRACRDAERIKQRVLDMEEKQEVAQEVSVPAGERQQGIEPLSQEAAQEPAPHKIYLAVPYREKDRAKAAGAKWDTQAKLWYAPEGADMTKLGAWLPRQEPTPAKTMDPREEFAQALRAAGLELSGAPVMDGKIHRVPVTGRPHAVDGAYQGFLDGHPAGWYQNYVTGEKSTWKAHGHTLTDEQKAALQVEAAERAQRRERERLAEQEKVARQCSQDFAERPAASSEHPYLLEKGVLPRGIKESRTGELLLVPLYNVDGDLRNVQEIHPDGSKRFQPGGQKKGCFCLIDPEKRLDQGEILLTEGYATGASVQMATEKPVAVAFDAGNLEPVARALREKYPTAKITICADNDYRHTNSNIGVEKAKQAAQAIGGEVAVPVFNKEEQAVGLKDFNDLHQSRGLKEVAAQVSRSRGIGRDRTFDQGRELSREMAR